MSNENQEIVELIKKSGYSVRKISKDLNIPEGRIYGWTNKKAKPTYEDGQKIRKYFGVLKDEPNAPIFKGRR